MRKAEFAEMILCRLTDKDRAASIVGDLVEQEKNSAWFWRAFVAVAGSLAWRPAIAFLIAFYVGNKTMGAFSMAVYGIHAKHVPDAYPWEPIFFCTTLIGPALWSIAMYALVRHGLRDAATQLVILSTGLITVFQYFWWQPAILVICLAAAMSVVAVSVVQPKLRKAAVVVLVAVAVASTTRIAAALLCDLYARLLRASASSGHDIFYGHPSLVWGVLSSLILSLYATVFAWSHMHTWMKARSPEESVVSD